MLVTSSEANKLIKTYLDEQKRLQNLEELSSSYIVATSENKDEVKPVYDFKEVQKQIYALNSKIRRIKHAINVFNSTTLLQGFGMTIDEALVYLPQLNYQASKLSSMANKLPKTRVGGRYGSNGTVEYEYVNYDIEDAADYCDNIKQEIIKLQSALDRVNNTVTFEIED